MVLLIHLADGQFYHYRYCYRFRDRYSVIVIDIVIIFNLILFSILFSFQDGTYCGSDTGANW